MSFYTLGSPSASHGKTRSYSSLRRRPVHPSTQNSLSGNHSLCSPNHENITRALSTRRAKTVSVELSPPLSTRRSGFTCKCPSIEWSPIFKSLFKSTSDHFGRSLRLRISPDADRDDRNDHPGDRAIADDRNSFPSVLLPITPNIDPGRPVD